MKQNFWRRYVLDGKNYGLICVCPQFCKESNGRSFSQKHGGDEFEVESAGFEPGEINPLVIDVMKEVGIDISQKSTQSVFDLYKGHLYSYVITVCDAANAQKCPLFPGFSVRLSWSFDDPAGFTGSYEEKLTKARLVRDQIRETGRGFHRKCQKNKVHIADK